MPLGQLGDSLSAALPALVPGIRGATNGLHAASAAGAVGQDPHLLPQAGGAGPGSAVGPGRPARVASQGAAAPPVRQAAGALHGPGASEGNVAQHGPIALDSLLRSHPPPSGYACDSPLRNRLPGGHCAPSRPQPNPMYPVVIPIGVGAGGGASGSKAVPVDATAAQELARGEAEAAMWRALGDVVRTKLQTASRHQDMVTQAELAAASGTLFPRATQGLPAAGPGLGMGALPPEGLGVPLAKGSGLPGSDFNIFPEQWTPAPKPERPLLDFL